MTNAGGLGLGAVGARVTMEQMWARGLLEGCVCVCGGGGEGRMVINLMLHVHGASAEHVHTYIDATATGCEVAQVARRPLAWALYSIRKHCVFGGHGGSVGGSNKVGTGEEGLGRARGKWKGKNKRIDYPGSVLDVDSPVTSAEKIHECYSCVSR